MEGSRRPTPAAQASAADRRGDVQTPKRRRVRIPTSVIVTLLVAALSVWIAPAFTRQWDDRQKERQLKAAFADEIATASARALAAGLMVADTERPRTRRDLLGQADARWEADALRISMKLTAYFGRNVGKRWTLFAQNVALFLDVCDWARSPFNEDSYIHYSAAIEDALRTITSRWIRTPRPRGDFVLETSRPEYMRGTARRLLSDVPGDRDDALAIAKSWLLRQTEQETAAVLAAHPAGFSTTRQDLIDDLLP